MSQRHELYPLTKRGVTWLIVIAVWIFSTDHVAQAGPKSVGECQRSATADSANGFLTRIDCYNAAMADIAFLREKAQDISDIIRAIQGTLGNDGSKTCLQPPYDKVVPTATGGYCSDAWNA